MSGINLTPAVSPNSLDQCWLCQSENGRDSAKNGHIRVSRHGADERDERTLANLALGPRCAVELETLAKNFDYLDESRSNTVADGELWGTKQCGFCNGQFTDRHSYVSNCFEKTAQKDGRRWSANVLVFNSEGVAERGQVALCEECVDILRTFLRSVGRDGQ